MEQRDPRRVPERIAYRKRLSGLDDAVDRVQKSGAEYSEGQAMTPNELLLWLSARKEGSWRQFRAPSKLSTSPTTPREN